MLLIMLLNNLLFEESFTQICAFYPLKFVIIKSKWTYSPLEIRGKLRFAIYWVFTAYFWKVNEERVGVDLTRFANKLFICYLIYFSKYIYFKHNLFNYQHNLSIPHYSKYCNHFLQHDVLYNYSATDVHNTNFEDKKQLYIANFTFLTRLFILFKPTSGDTSINRLSHCLKSNKRR